MQYVNDDMDELFRKAAKDYPLDTSGSDWSKIAAALQHEEPLPARKNNGRRFLWLLLLLPLALVCNHFWNNGPEQLSSTQHNTRVANSVPEKTVTSASSDHSRKDEPSGSVAITSKTGVIPSNTAGNQGNNKKNVNVPGVMRTTHQQASMTLAISGGTKNNRRDAAVKTANSEALASITETGAPISKGRRQPPSGNNEVVVNANDRGTEPAINRFNTGTTGTMEKGEENGDVIMNHTLRNIKVNGFPVPVPTGPLAARFDTLVKNPQPIRVRNRRNHLYIGVMAGLDATTIHFQKVQDAGYDYGVLLGYHLNRKWSIEAGVFMDKKFYYTSGQYFNSVKLYMPPNSKITEVAGNCRMIELPLNVQYLFSARPHASWFAGAGLSSYLMKKEDYAYEYYYGNSNTYATHNWSYNNSSKNYFSVLNLSAGYTTRLGRIANLRVEPYIKIPVKGLGYNNIRMVSGGLHLGFTKELF